MNARERRRIGPRMESAVEYVREHPGCSKGQVANFMFPDAPKRGFEAVGRAIIHGLILAAWNDDKRQFNLFVP